jgi:hypothetical protein
MHKLTIKLPADLVLRAKVRALREGVTLTQVIERLLVEYLKGARS